jgi:hypothetical protein
MNWTCVLCRVIITKLGHKIKCKESNQTTTAQHQSKAVVVQKSGLVPHGTSAERNEKLTLTFILPCLIAENYNNTIHALLLLCLFVIVNCNKAWNYYYEQGSSARSLHMCAIM